MCTALAFALLAAACGGGSASAPQRVHPPSFAEAGERPICLTLSVGGPQGLAHIGAIEAVQEAGMTVSCVVGNSMGALVGSLYASAPRKAVRKRYRGFMAAYEAEAKREAGGRGIIGAILGLAFAPVTGGASLAMAGAGAVVGAASTPDVDHARTVRVLDGYVAGAHIEDLPVPFATFYQRLADNRFVAVSSGNLAKAVGHSIANPLIFPDFDATKAGYLDPGLDRVARTPIEDTCKRFPRSRILAINVTGEPAHYARDLACPVLEVPIQVGHVPKAALRGTGPEYDRVVAVGRRATLDALVHAGVVNSAAVRK
jgi:NTE family protein